MRKRNRYTDEFKLDAVKLAMTEGVTLRETAEELGIHEGLLSRWIRQYREKGSESFSLGGLTPQEVEIRRLKKELAQVKMERDILKKATAFFAKESK